MEHKSPIHPEAASNRRRRRIWKLPGHDAAQAPPAQPVRPRTASHTRTQGQYLAFIYYYTKIHDTPPAETDMAHYFEVSPPAVHQMILTLERKGLIERTPGKPRSVRISLTRDEIPDLE